MYGFIYFVRIRLDIKFFAQSCPPYYFNIVDQRSKRRIVSGVESATINWPSNCISQFVRVGKFTNLRNAKLNGDIPKIDSLPPLIREHLEEAGRISTPPCLGHCNRR